MQKFFLYTILVIAYLGLAKALSPSEHGIQFLKNESQFSKILKSKNITVILIDTHATGFLIQTFYQKLRVITDYEHIDEMIVRTNKEFAKKNKDFIGLSIYRKSSDTEEFLPLPPGSLYIDNPEYGEWKTSKKGVIYWAFHKSYKNFPRYLGWGKFKITKDFFQQMKSSISLNRPFFGPNEEFGPNGKITKKNFPHFFGEDRKKKSDLKNLLLQYLKENF